MDVDVVSPILYFHYICFLYMSRCFGINLILNQTPNLPNYSKYAAITPTRGKAMANYPQELAQDAVCQSHTGHMTGLWFLPTRRLRLSTNE